MQALRWDIFCRVIDNFGDIGVCWRLSAALAARGQFVRLWVDEPQALAWMAPHGCEGVELRRWQPEQAMAQDTLPGDVVIEAFGCDIDAHWIAMNSIATNADFMPARGQNGLKMPVWINLEYLSAESYASRNHGLSSPVLAGPAQGLTKWFFYPGFTAATGGLIRESDAMVAPTQEPSTAQRISLFCYEPPALGDLLQQLAGSASASELHVLPGRGQVAVDAEILNKNALSPAWNMRRMLSFLKRDYLSQVQYDALLSSCELNFVRGEDSLVRALWAGRAFIWQIYPQSDGAHAAKLEAFLDWLQAPPDLREFHRVWNGLKHASLPPLDMKAWTACAQAARARLLAQRDLVSQLLDFVEEKRSA